MSITKSLRCIQTLRSIFQIQPEVFSYDYRKEIFSIEFLLPFIQTPSKSSLSKLLRQEGLKETRTCKTLNGQLPSLLTLWMSFYDMIMFPVSIELVKTRHWIFHPSKSTSIYLKLLVPPRCHRSHLDWKNSSWSSVLLWPWLLLAQFFIKPLFCSFGVDSFIRHQMTIHLFNSFDQLLTNVFLSIEKKGRGLSSLLLKGAARTPNSTKKKKNNDGSVTEREYIEDLMVH